jgi:hypothetical protein
MTKSLAMLFFMLSVTMFSIGLFHYLMQFDPPTPAPYPPLKVEAFDEMRRAYELHRMSADDDIDDADTDALAATAALDVHHTGCD